MEGGLEKEQKSKNYIKPSKQALDFDRKTRLLWFWRGEGLLRLIRQFEM